jgi:hypothetical protein
MKLHRILVASVAGLVAAASLPASAADDHSAIAVGMKANSRLTFGIESGDTPEIAIARAVKSCAEDGGKNCQVIDKLTYQACAAVSVDDDANAYYFVRPSRRTAEMSALDRCGKDACHILVSDCH